MERVVTGERPGWEDTAAAMGFTFHHMDGARYWDERAYYRFTLDEVEQGIEAPSGELHAICLDLVADVVGSEALMQRLAIPDGMRDVVAASWRADAPSLYGRFDFSFDGSGPAKLLEYNADTPTSIYETALFQWQWLEDRIADGTLPADADQYNRLHDALVARFGALFTPGSLIHFASVPDFVEDRQTVRYLEDAARQAGLEPSFVGIEAIGVDADGQLVDEEDVLIAALFKLYPWEDMLREPFSANLAGAGCHFLEPAWKALVSNKGILPVLWKVFPNHPNLLPSFFEDDVAGLANAAALMLQGHVTKPLFSREGASVTITQAGRILAEAKSRDYDAYPKIIQAYQPLPAFDGQHPVLGAWIVGQTCVGMGVREDKALITQDLSRFKPHFIEG